jgi:aryl-alcohol dehydrogenase-like predicted oxidoreductase
LGGSGIAVSGLCLGTDSIGSKIGRGASFELLDFYVEKGGNFFDTANFYASWLPGCVGGESESTIGAWLKERGNRDQIAIASKLGFDYPGCPGGLTAPEIGRECEKSLRRLGTDRIDLYYAHRDDPDTPLGVAMEAFNRLIRAGKVRAIGASNLHVWRIAEANDIGRMNGWAEYCAVEQRYTYFRPRHGAGFGPQICVNDELSGYCQARGMTVVAYSVLLQGAYGREDRPVPAQYAGVDSDERLAALREVAAQTGATVNQVVLAWILGTGPPVLPIIAGSTTGQLSENIAALDVKLTAEQMELLNTAGNPLIAKAWLR